jgi:hypothetical protein
MFLFRSRLLHCSFLLFCAALLLFGMSSRSSSLAFTAAGATGPDKRGIILYRRGALAAYAQPFRVLVDGKPVGFIANASYLRLSLAPGSHQLQIAPGGLAKVAALQIHAETGGSAFYEFVFPTGWDMRPSFEGAAIEPRDAPQALEALQELHGLNAAAATESAPNQRLQED